jgi:hydrogenase maturation protease
MNPMRVLSMARQMGAAWKRLLVVGCEPEPTTCDAEGAGGMGLSDAVQPAVEEAVKVVRRLI